MGWVQKPATHHWHGPAGNSKSVSVRGSASLRDSTSRGQNPAFRAIGRPLFHIGTRMPVYHLLLRIPRPVCMATAFVLYLLLLWMGGHQTTVDHLPGRADFSKVYHLVFYGGWCCLAWLSMRRPGIAAAVALTMLAGAGDEFHQAFLPFREARISDVAIDGAAALVAATIMHGLRKRAGLAPLRARPEI